MKSALLEKRLLHEISKCINEATTHLLSDLEACCDCQILALGGIVKEVLSIN